MWGFLSVGLFIFVVLCEVGFESFCKFAAGKHDTPSTAFAFQPNIRAKTDHGPFIGTARVLFPQAQVIVQLKVGKHVLLSIVSTGNSWGNYKLNYDKLRHEEIHQTNPSC